ncbi:Hypothetical protein EIN_415370, partial [Entamoeba invadens IP1]
MLISDDLTKVKSLIVSFFYNDLKPSNPALLIDIKKSSVGLNIQVFS